MVQFHPGLHMHYVYFLWSKKLQKIYIGETTNVKNRVDFHNKGLQRYKKKRIPWQFIAHVPFETKIEAKMEESRLKKCKNRSYYKKYIPEHGRKLSD